MQVLRPLRQLSCQCLWLREPLRVNPAQAASLKHAHDVVLNALISEFARAAVLIVAVVVGLTLIVALLRSAGRFTYRRLFGMPAPRSRRARF